MDDSGLDIGLWEHRFNYFWKTPETVYAGNRNISHAPVLDFSNELQLEFGAYPV